MNLHRMHIAHINKYLLKQYKLFFSRIWDAKVRLTIFSLMYSSPKHVKQNLKLKLLFSSYMNTCSCFKPGNEEGIWQDISFINNIKTLFIGNTLRAIILNLFGGLKQFCKWPLGDGVKISLHGKLASIWWYFPNPGSWRWPPGGAGFKRD